MGCHKLTYYLRIAIGTELKLNSEKKALTLNKSNLKGSSNYLYGFNGKERDTNLGGGTHYDYGFRIYNPRIAKFLSIDQLTRGYPMLTPYQFASNSPIWAIDLDGLEQKIVIQKGLEQMDVILGTEIWTDRNTSASQAIITNAVYHAGSNWNFVKFTLIKTSFTISGEGQITHVSQEFTDVAVSKEKDGRLSIEQSMLVESSNYNPMSNGDGRGVVTIDGFNHKVASTSNQSSARGLLSEFPTIEAFANLLSKNPKWVKSGNTAFTDDFAKQNVARELFNFGINLIDLLLPGAPVNPLNDVIKEDSNSKFKKTINLNKIFIPVGSESEAIKKFNNEVNSRVPEY